MLRMILIAVGIVISTAALAGDTQCYMVNGKFTCCTRVGNYTSCT